MSKTFAKSRCELFNEYHPRIARLGQYKSVAKEVHDVESRIMKQMTLTIKDGKLARMQEHKERLATAKPNSIAVKRPDLLDEWDWEKNEAEGLDPYQITLGMYKEAWWICPTYGKQHSFKQHVNTHVSAKNHCVYCSNKRVLVGFNDLASICPELLDEWDYEANEILPEQVNKGSSYKASWICKTCGNYFDMSVADRTKRGSRCPDCSKRERVQPRAIPIEGHSFADEYPDIASEWHPVKNGDKTPSDFRPHSNKSVWWQCQYGHEWETPINNRTGVNKRGCPKCAEYKNTSFPEKAIYYYVSQVFDDAVSNSLVTLDNGQQVSLDIWIPSIRIAIEYDGEHWHNNCKRDLDKDNQCFENGIKLIRVCEPKCAAYDDVISTTRIARNGTHDDSSLNEAIIAVMHELGIDGQVMVDVSRNESEIRALLVASRVENSFGENYPELISEWHPTMNGLITPFMVAQHSGAKAWFVCPKCGESYRAAICDRSYGSGHYACSMKSLGEKKMVPKSGQSVMDLYPDLSSYWHPTKNGSYTPRDLKPHSQKKFWWICEDCGCAYESQVAKRTQSGASVCRNCARKRAGQSRRDKRRNIFAQQVAEANPTVELLGEYDQYKATVKCRCKQCGHTWMAWPQNLLNGHACNVCAQSKRRAARKKNKEAEQYKLLG